MAEVVLHKLELDDEVRKRLLEIARSHGRSVEEEVSAIVRVAVLSATTPGLGSRIAARFDGIGLKDVDEIEEMRARFPEPLNFDQ